MTLREFQQPFATCTTTRMLHGVEGTFMWLTEETGSS